MGFYIRFGLDQAYPISLEAILRAEKTLLHPKFKAGGALKRSSIVITIAPHAFSRREGFGSHFGKFGSSDRCIQAAKVNRQVVMQ
jgi:hypothetical protein